MVCCDGVQNGLQLDDMVWSSLIVGRKLSKETLRLPGTYDAKIDENQTPLARFPQQFCY